MFFKDLKDTESPLEFHKEMQKVEGKLREAGIAYGAVFDRPYFLPGVGTPKRGWAEQGAAAEAAGEAAAVEASCAV